MARTKGKLTRLEKLQQKEKHVQDLIHKEKHKKKLEEKRARVRLVEFDPKRVWWQFQYVPEDDDSPEARTFLFDPASVPEQPEYGKVLLSAFETNCASIVLGELDDDCEEPEFLMGDWCANPEVSEGAILQVSKIVPVHQWGLHYSW